MDSPLGSIRDLSGGVIGTCFVVQGNLIGTTLPGYTGQQEVTRAAEAFQTTCKLAGELGLNVAYSTVTFGDTRVLFADLEGSVLVVFHQEETDVGVLTDHIDRNKDALAVQVRDLLSPVAPPPPPRPPEGEPRVALPPRPPPVDDDERADRLHVLAADLDRILEGAVAEVGPAATVLLDDALDGWLADGRPEATRLPVLLDRLTALLPNQRVKDAFRARMRGAR